MRDTTIEALIEKIPLFKNKSLEINSLSGGITNQNYKIDSENHSFVLRKYGENSDLLGIDRSVEIIAQENASALGISPEVVFHSEKDALVLSEFIDGETLNESQVQTHAASIGKLIHKYHCAKPLPNEFCPFEVIRTYQKLASDRGIEDTIEINESLRVVSKIEEKAKKHQTKAPCHNDLLCANFIKKNEQIWIIDWEYAAMGDPYFDLGNLAVNNQFNQKQKETLLSSYLEKVTDQNRAQLHLMCLVSDLREAMWSHLQRAISKIDFDYEKYAKKHFVRFLEESQTKETQESLNQL